MQLSIRDRDELTDVLCHHQPDLLTSSVRSIVTSYEPVLRALHKAVDLSSGVSDLQAFLADLIKLSTIHHDPQGARSSSVEDFCLLLRRHARSSHRFMHQALKNSHELTSLYRAYASHAASQYRRTGHSEGAAGDFTQNLLSMYFRLTEDEQAIVSQELALHAKYLAEIAEISSASFEGIVENLAQKKSSTSHGPGIYISKWEGLMHETPFTPENEGGLRTAKDMSVQQANSIDTDGARKGYLGTFMDSDRATRPLQPRCTETIRLLAPSFRSTVASIDVM